MGLKTDIALASLAERLGVAQNTMSMWKTLGIVDYSKVISLCEKNGLSLDWIIAGSETAPGVAESRLREMQFESQLARKQIELLQDTTVRISTKAARHERPKYERKSRGGCGGGSWLKDHASLSRNGVPQGCPHRTLVEPNLLRHRRIYTAASVRIVAHGRSDFEQSQNDVVNTTDRMSVTTM